MHYLQNIETDVDHFIDEFMGGQFSNEYDQEFLRSKFRSGYCYYFAHILQLAFSRGLVCWTAPFGHFVWLDTNKKANEITVNEVLNTNAYDIEGRYRIEDTEAFYLIPEKYLTKKHISEFLHTKPQYKPTTKDDLIKVVKKYCKTTGVPYDNIEYWFTN